MALLNRNKGRNLIDKGFTLVELMIVIVIVGILSAVALPNFLNQTNKARASEGKTQVSVVLKEAGIIYHETGEMTSDGCDSVDAEMTLANSAVDGKYTLTNDCEAEATAVEVTATGAGDNYPDVVGTITLATGVVEIN